MLASSLRAAAPRNTALIASSRLTGLSRHFASTTAARMAHAHGPIAVVAGVGPGTGGSVARRFAKKYPTLLLARNPDNFKPLVEEIEKNGGSALGVSTDLTSASAIKDALHQAAQKWGSGSSNLPIAAAVYNVGGIFKRAPFLELTEEDFALGLTTGATGGFNFAKAALPGLLAYAETTGSSAGPHKGKSAQEHHSADHPPTLIFTGATASVKGSANFASFAAAKHALRAMAQSLAREFMPKGVHVSHAIIDGVIDIERTKAWDVPGKIDPAAIAESYWALHAQPKTAWTWEIDLRPWVEKW